jgi:formylglycine-generating enzyme required for sulfatase activity
MSPTNAQLRQFIMDAFNDEELVTLCFDYFPEVSQNFSDGMTKNRKVLALISYCDSRGLRDNLHVTLAKERPSAWQAQFASPSETFRGHVSAPASQTPAPRNPHQIFLSHATADAEFAQQLAADLRQEGWPVWIAPESIAPGEKWVEAINRGLEESGIFVAALTPDAVASRWVQTETNAAIDLHHANEMRLVTLDVAQCRLPVLWRQYQYIPFRASYETGLNALLGWLDGRPPQPVETGRRPVSTPADPNRRIHVKTGIELVRIPAGPFLYGSSDSDELAHDNEKPQQTVELPEYWIGRTPVTNAQFAAFVQLTFYRTTAEKLGSALAWAGSSWDIVRGADWRHPNGPDSDIRGKANHPVVQVSWDDALAFCEWAGLQLPTEQAWEKAARGTDGRTWPWGDDRPTADHGNFNNNIRHTTPVGDYSPRGDSPYGCVDMAGNVWEWTASWYQEGTARAVRGGAWYDDDRTTRAAYRELSLALNGDGGIGFRVVKYLSDLDT